MYLLESTSAHNIAAIKCLLTYKNELDKLICDINKAIEESKEYIELKLIEFPENWIEILKN